MDKLHERAQAIRLAIFDVDGVLTDGRLYFMPDGTEFKSFNTLDGHGIKMLMASGVETAIISGRKSPLVERRAANLGIKHLIQGREDKLTALNELRQIIPVEMHQPCRSCVGSAWAWPSPAPMVLCASTPTALPVPSAAQVPRASSAS